MQEKEIGRVTHYYGHLGVAIIDLSDDLKKGDRVHVIGHTTDFEEPVDSIEKDMKQVDQAKKGESVGITVAEKVREHDKVYKIE